MGRKEKELSARQVKVAETLLGLLLKMQRSWSARMGNYVNGLSLPVRKICFYAWCCVAAIPCCMLILKPFTRRPDVPVGRVVPRSAPGLPRLPVPEKTDQQEMDRAVKRFNQFRDSLEKEGGAAWERFRRMYKLKNIDTTKILR